MVSSCSRFGWSIKKALGSAVRRNRIRRRLREILRLHRQEISPGWDIVIHPRSSAATADFAALSAGIAKLIPRARKAVNSVCAPARVEDRRGKSAAAWTLLLLVRIYITFLSPFFGGACRFHPSCSNYAAEAIALHGACRGTSLALRRLLRCNPFNKGGFDPVPDANRARDRCCR